MSRSVLVVEDDEPTRAMIAALLEDEGYRVRAAADGADALRLLSGWRPDVIVLDVAMPGVDAFEFRAVQVGIPGAADVPVLLTSATRVADLARIAADVGAADWIAKPFDAEEFVGIVARLSGRAA